MILLTLVGVASNKQVSGSDDPSDLGQASLKKLEFSSHSAAYLHHFCWSQDQPTRLKIIFISISAGFHRHEIFFHAHEMGKP